MYQISVFTAHADSFGPLPAVEHTFPVPVSEVPEYETVRDMMIAEGVRARISAIHVKHIFLGRVTHRLEGEYIVPVNNYLKAFGF